MRIPRLSMLVLLCACDASNEPDTDTTRAGTGGHAGDGVAQPAGAGQGSPGGQGDSGGQGGRPGPSRETIIFPKVFPIVRANTPSALIADSAFASGPQASFEVLAGEDAGVPPAGDESAIQLALAVQERLYTAGPTELLRLVHELDQRTARLDGMVSGHACLATTPVVKTIRVPGRQPFVMQLQCLEQHVGGWMAFGFADSPDAEQRDAGVASEHARDFYLVEGQVGGMGGAYHVHEDSDPTKAEVEAWITVADSRVPTNSQVLMHLLSRSVTATTELTFAGSGVGFCSAHLKVSPEYLFIQAKTNAALPPGAAMDPAVQYCDSLRLGCFATSALDVNLGPAAVGCRDLRAASFAIRTSLDASAGAGANVTPAAVHEYFTDRVSGVPAY